MRRGLFGDHASIGDKVSELRIHYGAGYRAYFTLRGRQVVILLVGGTKRTQARDILRAKAMAQQL
jgi:putative addiction module killer protein